MINLIPFIFDEEDKLPDVVVIIPTTTKDLDKAKDMAKAQHLKAGMPCDVYIIENDIGWVAACNYAVKNIKAKYYVYSCSDYYPGLDWLIIAYNHLMKYEFKLVGFNDGKWGGYLATVGLIEAEYMKSNYEGNLFYPKYQNHFADTELTKIAQRDGYYGYNSNAVLMELDDGTFFKMKNDDLKILQGKKMNQKDVAIFESRKEVLNLK